MVHRSSYLLFPTAIFLTLLLIGPAFAHFFSEEQLTVNNAAESTPRFSPDGSKIAFVSDRDGDFEIFIMNSDGSDQRQLTFNSVFDLSPQFSPDGSKIAFVSNRDGDIEIFIMNSDGSGQEQLTFTAGVLNTRQRFSPDGSKIVFESNRDGDIEIFIMNSDGSDQEQLTVNGGGDGFPMFSPDGNFIACARAQNVNCNLPKCRRCRDLLSELEMSKASMYSLAAARSS
ncbi:MAG: DPP IV N-terminal domain-containing protein [Thaumarchaeota archaeon]|nr:DPP IV N-terminal domain-containing protein [Nitrososphaerota archaeon]